MKNLEKEIRSQPQVLRGLRGLNDETINKILDRVEKDKPAFVYFAARGTSDHACTYAQYLFGIYLGVPCALATPSVVSRYGAELDLSRALVIGVSQSGKAEDVISVIERGKKCGAATVALTNDTSSPLAKAADYVLDCGAGPELSIAATKTFTAQMYVLATLCARWAQRLGKVPPESTGLSSADELLAALDKLPDAIERLLETVPPQIDSIILRYRYLENAFVLARGINYPIALEGSLKILETNRIKVRGYSIADFYHGPLAQIGAGTLVIVLAARGKLLGDASDIMLRIESLEPTGCDIIAITDDEGIADKWKLSIKIPSSPGLDSISPFLFAVTLQLFALKLTDIKEIDPDETKALKKVTITK